MRILTMDCELGLKDEETGSFRSDVSMFDFDVVIWDPAQTIEEYLGMGEYLGLRQIYSADSAALLRDMLRRYEEFEEFLRLGRTLVVFMPGDIDVYADTGKREFSGTGRNRSTTHLVKRVNLLDALPMSFERSSGTGTSLEAAGALTADLYRKTKDAWVYKSVIDSSAPAMEPLFYLRGTKKVVGGLVRQTTDRGMLVMLPDFVAEETKWSEYSTALLEWILSLSGDADAELPPWAASLLFDTEIARTDALEALDKQLADVLRQVEQLRASQAQDEQWKLLLAGSGAALERQVQRAFELFGFAVEGHDIGRSDLRATYGDKRVVVEVKGLNKSAAEKNAAQLEKWVSGEVEEGRAAKGILVVTGWRNTPLFDRSESVFPAQMVTYSERRDHCLVSGTQLLVMVRACIEDPSRADECARTLLETTGVVQGWGDYESIITRQEIQDSMKEADGSGLSDDDAGYGGTSA